MTTTTDTLTDEQFDAADRIEAAMEQGGRRDWSPSEAARKAGTDTATARIVLAWMARHQMVASSGNGNWTRYSAR